MIVGIAIQMTVFEDEIIRVQYKHSDETTLIVKNCIFHCHTTNGGAIYYMSTIPSISAELTNNAFYHCRGSDYAAYFIYTKSFVSTQTCIYSNDAAIVMCARGNRNNTHTMFTIAGCTGSGVPTYFDHGNLTLNNANSTHNRFDSNSGLLVFTSSPINKVQYSQITRNDGTDILHNGGQNVFHYNSHINIVRNKARNCLLLVQLHHTFCTDVSFVGNMMHKRATLVGQYSRSDAETVIFDQCKFDFPETDHSFATFNDYIYLRPGDSLSDIQVFTTDLCVIPSPRHRREYLVFKHLCLLALE